MIILTAFTSGEGGGGYEQELPEWAESVAKHCPSSMVVRDLGSMPWRQAVMLKPRVIHATLEAYEEDVLWLDVDAKVRKPLTYIHETAALEEKPDLMVRKRETEHLSGTLWVSSSSKALTFMATWKELAMKASLGLGDYAKVYGDQDILGMLLESQHYLDVSYLPPEYCLIFDLDRPLGCDPVVEHFQASRRRRR